MAPSPLRAGQRVAEAVDPRRCGGGEVEVEEQAPYMLHARGADVGGSFRASGRLPPKAAARAELEAHTTAPSDVDGDLGGDGPAVVDPQR